LDTGFRLLFGNNKYFGNATPENIKKNYQYIARSRPFSRVYDI